MPLRCSGDSWVFSTPAFAGLNLRLLWWSICSYSDGFCSIIVHYWERGLAGFMVRRWNGITIGSFNHRSTFGSVESKLKLCCFPSFSPRPFFQFSKGDGNYTAECTFRPERVKVLLLESLTGREALKSQTGHVSDKTEHVSWPSELNINAPTSPQTKRTLTLCWFNP